MSLTLRVGEVVRSGPAASRVPGGLWAPLATAGAVLTGVLYAASAPIVGPWALPLVLCGLVASAVSLRRPGFGVAVAYLLTSLSPGMVGQTAWMYGAAWTLVLVGLLLVRADSAGERHGRLPPLALAVLLYGATVLGAFAMSPDADLGLPILRSTLTGILLFLVAATTLRTWSDITSVLLGVSGAAILAGGLACLQQVLGVATGIGFVTSTGALVARVTGGFNHPNQLAGFLVLLVPLSFAGVLVDRRWRVVHLAALVLALGGIYASFSRGALLALLVMPFLLLRGRGLLLLGLVAVIGLGLGLPSVMSERFVLGGREGAEIAGRRDIWATASSIWVEEPLLGTGLGGFPGTYAAVRVSGKQFLANTQFEPPPHAHNLGLQLLAEQGLVGFATFGTVAAVAARRAIGVRRSRRRDHAVLGAALLAALLGGFVHNLFDVTILENGGVQLWGTLGVLSALVGLDRSEGVPDGW